MRSPASPANLFEVFAGQDIFKSQNSRDLQFDLTSGPTPLASAYSPVSQEQCQVSTAGGSFSFLYESFPLGMCFFGSNEWCQRHCERPHRQDLGSDRKLVWLLVDSESCVRTSQRQWARDRVWRWLYRQAGSAGEEWCRPQYEIRNFTIGAAVQSNGTRHEDFVRNVPGRSECWADRTSLENSAPPESWPGRRSRESKDRRDAKSHASVLQSQVRTVERSAFIAGSRHAMRPPTLLGVIFFSPLFDVFQISKSLVIWQ